MCHGMSVRQIFVGLFCLLAPLFASSDGPSWDVNYKQGLAAFDAGRYSEAAQALTAAVDQARVFSPVDTRLVKSTYTLALTYYVQGQPALAEPLYLEAKNAVEGMGESGRPMLGYVLEALGELRMQQARWQESEQLLERAVAVCIETHGETHSCTLTAQRRLGELLSMQGRNSEAEGIFQKLIGTLRQAPSSPELLVGALTNLGGVYNAQGRFALAEPLLRESLAVASQSAITGPALADSLVDLGQLYRLEGDSARAEPLLQKALVIYEKVNDPHQAGALNELGLMAMDEKKFAIARDYLSRSLSVYQKIVGSTHLFAARVKAGLAEAFLGERDIQKARTLVAEALTTERQALGSQHCEYARLLTLAGKVEEAGRQGKQADKYYRQALDIYRQNFRDGHPERSQAERNYARFVKSLRN
ncbi:MAG TPA: tetratricopeptide repeat protein [Bryobacteraceae bacterium]|nr:tetratricopeptide repeat protein [Bryobacteraceae bacterium]